MTIASWSPNLTLMLPKNSDTFDPADFVKTFANIDAAPGITRAASWAAMKDVKLAALSAGMIYIQTDNGAMWMWSGTSWWRINTGCASAIASGAQGLLGSDTAAAAPKVVTKETNSTTSKLCQVNYTAVGGRVVVAHYVTSQVTTSVAGGSFLLTMWVDGQVADRFFGVTLIGGNIHSASVFRPLGLQHPGDPHVVTMTLSTAGITAATGYVSAPAGGQLFVYEI